MEATLPKSGAARNPASSRLADRLRSAARAVGASVDRYLNRLYENLPKDRPNV